LALLFSFFCFWLLPLFLFVVVVVWLLFGCGGTVIVVLTTFCPLSKIPVVAGKKTLSLGLVVGEAGGWL